MTIFIRLLQCSSLEKCNSPCKVHVCIKVSKSDQKWHIIIFSSLCWSVLSANISWLHYFSSSFHKNKQLHGFCNLLALQESYKLQSIGNIILTQEVRFTSKKNVDLFLLVRFSNDGTINSWCGSQHALFFLTWIRTMKGIIFCLLKAIEIVSTSDSFK